MHKKITALLFLLVICVSMAGIFSYGLQKVMGQFDKIDVFNDATDTSEKDDSIAKSQTESTITNTSNADAFTMPLEHTYEKIISIHDKMEAKFNNIFPKFTYIQYHGLLQRTMGKRMVNDVSYSNGVVKLNNGYLTSITPEPRDINTIANNLIDFNHYLKEKQIDMLYVQAPHKISKFDNQLPIGIYDYSNENTDAFLSIINSADVDYIDLRQEMYDDHINQYDMFFNTDHHWKPEAGLWAFGKVSERLNTQYEFHIDKKLYNPQNYNYKIYRNWFLGSHGKRVGTLYGGIDDITLITPKFETSLNLNNLMKKIKKIGDFKDVIFDYTKIEEKNYFSLNVNDTYLGGQTALIQIQNIYVNDKKMLLIRDSFANTFIPFMALGCSELNAIDLRHYNSKDLDEYIDNTNPDIVMILYYPGVLSEVFFTFD